MKANSTDRPWNELHATGMFFRLSEEMRAGLIPETWIRIRAEQLQKDAHRIMLAAKSVKGCTGILTDSEALQFALEHGGFDPKFREPIREAITNGEVR